MVYCGKPSKGCSLCRQRKIRCDQKIPACGQCEKLERECPGYRNMLDLAFRNESEDVIKKAKAKAKSRKSPARPKYVSPTPSTTKEPRDEFAPETNAAVSSVVLASRSPQWASGFQRLPTLFSDYNDWLDTEQSQPTYSMQPNIDDNGFNYFISNFVRPPSGPSHGHFAFIHHMCSDGTLDDALKTAITAAGLAGSANKAKSSPLMARAYRTYAIALRKINAALRSPTEALKDCTLLAIIIVAIFESITGAKQLSLKEWTEHVNGAATLIKLRGRNQLKQKDSLSLFHYATSHVTISCIQREISMPSQLVELRAEALTYVPVDPCHLWIPIADEITVFRNDVRTGAFKDSEAIIARATALDIALTKAFTDVPPGWVYETVFTDTDCEVVFDGSYDIYYDHWIAEIWNGMRCTRIMLHETIRSQLIKSFNSTPRKYTPEAFRKKFQASVDVCSQMRDDTFRSVPQHLGFVTRKPFTSRLGSNNSSSHYVSDFSSEVEPSISHFLDFDATASFTDLLLDDAFIPPIRPKESLHRDPTHPSIGGYFLLWPLYVSGVTRVSTAEHRTFVANILEYVGEVLGIRAGSNMAMFMKEHSIAPRSKVDGEGIRMGNETQFAGSIAPEGESFVDEKPKRPLMEMLAREEAERAERIRMAREEVGG